MQTGQSTETLGLTNRGKIATGMAADLVLFDTATIAGRADYKLLDMPSAGISLVVVNRKPARKMKHLLVQAMALFFDAMTNETGSEYAPLTSRLNIYSIGLSAHQLALPLSHTCHTEID
jgi:hypothetical protein